MAGRTITTSAQRRQLHQQQQQQARCPGGGGGGRQPKRRRPRPPGVLPVNLRRHADSICILAKAQPRVVRQLIAGADSDLIKALSECAANVLNGNLIIDPAMKSRLAKHADHLRLLRRRNGSQRGKKALLMKGGFVGLLASTVAPLLIRAIPSVIGSIIGSRRRKRRR